MQKLRSIAIILLLLPLISQSNEKQELRRMEDSLVALSRRMHASKSDAEKLEINDSFTGLLYEVLSWRESYSYPFDSLTLLSKLWAPDQAFRIFTWYVPLAGGIYEYGGIVHIKGRERNFRFLLSDESENMKDPLKVNGDHREWYGAVYYEIILTKSSGRKYYTLLGWDGARSQSNRKIIEVMTLKGGVRPSFGHNIFKAGNSQNKRYIFEYSGNASMLLKYDEQLLTYTRNTVFRGKTDRKKQVRTIKKSEKMVVFDRLVPLHSSLEGRYEYYVPATNIVDAFIWRDGKWHLARDIDARNQEIKVKRKDKPRPPVQGIIPPG